MADKFEYNEEVANSNYPLYEDNWVSQSFFDTIAYTITYVQLKLHRTGDGGNVIVSIRKTDGADKPVGNDLCVSNVVDCSDITTGTDGEWITFTFTSSYSLLANTVYAIVARCDSALINTIRWKTDTTSPSYPNGQTATSSNAGSSWTTTANDAIFRAYGNITLVPTDKTYSRKLIAIAANEFWYASSLGTLEELADANNDINTTLSFDALEAYQKIFIANKSNLKVADFTNTKITTGDIKPSEKVIPLQGDILTGGNSEASMVVDYIDASDGTCNVYGFRTTVTTFTNEETVTGTNSNGDISFTLNANEDAPPHWYNWTVYSGDVANFGAMPTSATLLALYRGRIVTAGDTNHPHQWWMTKVGNPWKFLYDYSNDGDLSAVSYSNTKVGLIGDIITALIPYKDDLLIFGCANSLWILIGDPLSSGQVAKITGSTGIWGKESWCIDDRGNLYFLGSDGIYKIPISESISQPENISKLSLPNLMTDWDLDKSLHRVVLTFDPVHYGIIISKTLLDGGTNKNYWFDLKLQGFFPETYPEECGIYSSYYYKSTDDTYTKLLVGCDDGYIREFLDSEKDDDIGDTNEAISSYVVLPIKLIAENEDKEGKLLWLNGVTAGGASGGNFLDSDSVDWSIYVGDDAETVLEDIKDGAIAFATGSWDGAGKQNKSRVKARGSYLGIKLANSTEDETWAINKVFGEIKSVGRLK